MCDYFSHNEITTMNTTMNPSSNIASLENLNLVAVASTLLAGLYFIAVNFIF